MQKGAASRDAMHSRVRSTHAQHARMICTGTVRCLKVCVQRYLSGHWVRHSPQVQLRPVLLYAGCSPLLHCRRAQHLHCSGVGITAQLPGENVHVPTSHQPATNEFQDPTERVAIALGLHIHQLAHYTHKQPGNPLAAIHRLR